MPYKTFVNGFPLNASELNTFVMPQTNAIFADATERTAAIATPIEGQLSYLQDQNKTYRYDGSSWVEMQGMSSQVSQAVSPNYIINGAFDIWQRGTSFTNPGNGSSTYVADRFQIALNAPTTTHTVTQQTFTPNELNAIGYGEANFYLRSTLTTAGSASIIAFQQKIENVRTFADQIVTLSFWAKADTARTLSNIQLIQNFGSGGSGNVASSTATASLTTSWQRFTFTYDLASISGKTIGANSFLLLYIELPTTNGSTIDIWGVQLEAGSVATPFRRNANSLQGELAACQRYYVRYGAVEGLTVNAFAAHALGFTTSTTEANAVVALPVTMRSASFTLDYANIAVADSAGNFFPIVTMAASNSSRSAVGLYISGLTGVTANRPARILNNNNTSGYLGISTEL